MHMYRLVGNTSNLIRLSSWRSRVRYRCSECSSDPQLEYTTIQSFGSSAMRDKAAAQSNISSSAADTTCPNDHLVLCLLSSCNSSPIKLTTAASNLAAGQPDSSKQRWRGCSRINSSTH
ncbi:hypothetical protein DOTSEDRAFT_152792 [Dothistroma septosporum NZE10]|uniref:Uncharacterized protein n=1 Tax=Dothistroma septosporum (strain NZE10 / CBS 128990) TaxID=675120 RepID=N1PMY9_DOTSN|nr:hypothetical protein DOTSEDRAFT_152792 [Dothistroma septosporum NZE10]